MRWWRPPLAEEAPTDIEVHLMLHELEKLLKRFGAERFHAGFDHVDWLMLAIEGEWRLAKEGQD